MRPVDLGSSYEGGVLPAVIFSHRLTILTPKSIYIHRHAENQAKEELGGLV